MSQPRLRSTRYPSDLPDARWELIEPVLTAWRAERRAHALDIGRPPGHDLCTIMRKLIEPLLPEGTKRQEVA